MPQVRLRQHRGRREGEVIPPFCHLRVDNRLKFVTATLPRGFTDGDGKRSRRISFSGKTYLSMHKKSEAVLLAQMYLWSWASDNKWAVLQGTRQGYIVSP